MPNNHALLTLICWWMACYNDLLIAKLFFKTNERTNIQSYS
jgi:hypothetical protein